MGPISAEVEVDAPREAAFELISDLARRPNYTDHFLTGFHLTRIDARGIGAGARFRVERATALALGGHDDRRARGAVQDRRARRSGGRSNRIPTHTVWEFEPGRSGMTILRVTHWTTPKEPVDKLVESLSFGARFQQKGWKKALNGFATSLRKADPEASASPSPGGTAI